MTPDVSIVIPSWNVGHLLRECLKSLFDSSTTTFEVIVVDNNSTDPAVAHVRSEFPQVCWIQNVTNLGFAGACNLGLKAAQGRFLLLLNNDCTVGSKTLKGMVDFLNLNPSCGVASCKSYASPDDSTPRDAGCRYLPSFRRLLLQGFLDSSGLLWLYRQLGIQASVFGNDLDPSQVHELQQVTGAFFMIRREVITDVGYLDDDYFLYLEETDYCTRATARGWKVMYNPAVSFVHLGSVASQLLPDREKIYAVSMAKYLRRHRGTASAIGYSCVESAVFRPLRRLRDTVRQLVLDVFPQRVA